MMKTQTMSAIHVFLAGALLMLAGQQGYAADAGPAAGSPAQLLQIVDGGKLDNVSTQKMTSAAVVKYFQKWVYVHSTEDYSLIEKGQKGLVHQFERGKDGMLTYVRDIVVPQAYHYGDFLFKSLPSGDGIVYWNMMRTARNEDLRELAWYSVSQKTGDWTPLGKTTLTNQGGFLLSPDKKFLYIVGVKILVFALDDKTGIPTKIADTVEAYPYQPRAWFNSVSCMTSDGKQILSGGFGADSMFHVGVYDRDAKTGLVSPRKSDLAIPDANVKDVIHGWYDCRMWMTPDGKHIYAQFNAWDHPLTITIVARNGDAGTLSFVKSFPLGTPGILGLEFTRDSQSGYIGTGAPARLLYFTRDSNTGEWSKFITVADKEYEFMSVAIDAENHALYATVFLHNAKDFKSKLYVYKLP